MTIISNDEFNTFAAQGYNHIPVVREVLADLDTPLSAYMKLASGSRSYLLESVQGGEKWGRYSIIGLTANTVLRVSDDIITIEVGSKTISEKQTTDPFAEIDNFLKQYRVPDIKGLPRFSGGLVGYFGYDCVRYIEPRLGAGSKQDPLACPDIMLMVSDRIVVFDNVRGKLMIIVHADPSQDDAYAKAQYDLDMLVNKLKTTVIDNSKIESPRTVNEDDFVSGFTQENYQQAVAKIKDYIVEGDVMQVVLSQRLSIPYHAPPLNLYRALRSMNPSPNMFYINFDEFQVVGASPEILVRLEDDTVTVRPIAGTRPRSTNDV